MTRYPFKFLDAYESQDADIFFGRKDEIDALYEMLFRTNILWVYGPSGTGKTSLIQCGLASKFEAHDWMLLKITRGNDINKSLSKVLEEAAGTTKPVTAGLEWLTKFKEDRSPKNISPVLPLAQTVRNIYFNSFRPIYLVFDQFEELFILGTKEEYDAFIETFISLLKIEQPLKIIFAIREDYLGYLYEFEKSVPQLMRKKLRLEPVDLEKVEEIIKGAVALDNSNIKLEEGNEKEVIRQIFNKVKDKEKSRTIQLPYLQVFLDKLYMKITGDEERNTEAVFSLAALKDMGDINNVLRDFLEDQVSAITKELERPYPQISAKMIWSVLSPFVSLENTKEPISKEELYIRLHDLKSSMIDDIVAALYRKRIIRHSQETGLYELAHDSLGERIAEKRNNYEITLLEIRRLIKSQANVYDQTGDLFSEKEIALIEPFLQELLKQKLVDSNGMELLNLSREKIAEQKEIEKEREIQKAKKEAEKKAKEEKKALEKMLKEAEDQKKEIELDKERARVAFEKMQLETEQRQAATALEFEKYRSRRKAKMYTWLFAAAALLILVVVVSFLRTRHAYRTAEENRYWLIANILKRSGNPTLSYLAIQEGLKKNPDSDTLTKQLSELEASNLVYLQGVYPVMSEVSGVTLDADSILTISGKTARTTWNTMNRSLTQVINYEEAIESKEIKTSIGTLTASLNSSFIEIKGIKGSSLVKVPKKDIYDLEDVIVSNDGRFLLANNSLLYDLQSSKSKNLTPSTVVTVPKYSTDKYTEEQKIYLPTASVFLKDDQFAIGYESGDVIVFAYNSNKKDHLDTLELFTSSNDSYAENNQVIKMAADRKYKSLFASNSQSEIGVCDLGQLKGRQSETDGTPRKTNALDSSAIKDLEDGHTGPVDCLTFSADDSLMLSGSNDNTAILWDISTKNIKRISILKGPNSSEITAARFFNNDSDIITISSKTGSTAISRVYLWKRARPSAIPRNQLYNFSPFDFSVWGLAADTTLPKATPGLYRSTLDYYLNLPVTSEFPNEKSYNQKLAISLFNARRSYSTLKNKSDYRTVISSYADSLLYLCRYAHLPHIEQDILDAGNQINQWKEYFTDTVNNKLPFALTSKVSMPFSLLTERQSPNYDEGLRLLRFYTDTVWYPLAINYPDNSNLKSFRKNIDICWTKYYLYTGQTDSALKFAIKLSQNEIRGINYNIWLIATYVVTGKGEDADSLYVKTQIPMKGYIKTINDNRLRNFLKRLKEKNIAEEDIDKFISDVKLEEKED